MVHSAQNQGQEGSPHLVPSPSPSRAEITAHAITSAVESARKRGQRHPHSGSANTKMRTRIKQRAGNTISRSLSKCPLNTSWCAAPRRARVHVLTYQLESLALLVIWSTLSIQKEWIWRNMQRWADPLADLSQHFQSGPEL